MVPLVGCLTDKVSGREKMWSTTLFRKSDIRKFSKPVIIVSTDKSIVNAINLVTTERMQPTEMRKLGSTFPYVIGDFQDGSEPLDSDPISPCTLIYANTPSRILIEQLHTNHSGVILLLRPEDDYKTQLAESEDLQRVKGVKVGLSRQAEDVWEMSSKYLYLPEKQEMREGSFNTELEAITCLALETLHLGSSFFFMKMAAVDLNLRLANQATIIHPSSSSGCASNTGSTSSSP